MSNVFNFLRLAFFFTHILQYGDETLKKIEKFAFYGLDMVPEPEP
jgi:hypothetical protein